MNGSMTFCEHCRDDVLYIEKDIDMQTEIKGEVYNYTGKKAFCK